jgi:hypothetical protein
MMRILNKPTTVHQEEVEIGKLEPEHKDFLYPDELEEIGNFLLLHHS